jgi:hypothetical protein
MANLNRQGNPSLIDLTGRRFGRLSVIERGSTICYATGWAVTTWICKCDCGAIKIIRSQALRNGMTQSCGCLQKELTAKRMKLSNLLSQAAFTVMLFHPTH